MNARATAGERRSDTIRQALVGFNKARRERRRIALVDELIRQFNGPVQFARRMKQADDYYMSRGQHRNVLTLLVGMTKLMHMVARPEPTPSELTDEQLSADKASLLERMILDGTVAGAVRQLVRDGRLDAEAVQGWCKVTAGDTSRSQ